MEYDFSFFIIAAAAMVFSGISKAGFGSGASFAGASLLSIFIDPAVALGITLPLFMLADVVALPPFWNKWSWPAIKPIVLGSLPGVGLGVFLYRSADADLLRVLLGLISLAFVCYQVLQIVGFFSSTPRKLSTRIGGLVGAIAGFTSFISHAGGPPVAVYLLAQEMDKTTYHSSTVLIFTIINIFKFVPYAFLGMFTLETLWIDAILAPFILVGAFVGVRAHFLVPEKLFFILTYAMLLITGIKFLRDGLSG